MSDFKIPQMQRITSRDNQKLKLARKARDRRLEDLIFVEGWRLAEEALRSKLNISDIFFSEGFAKSARGEAFLQKTKHFNLYEVSEQIFNTLSATRHPQGVILTASRPQVGKSVVEINLSGKSSEFPLVILLHQINNPANLGAVLRTAEAAGVCGVILTENSADPFSPKALRGAMGASFRLPVWTNADYFEVLDWAVSRNLIPICADINSRKSYTEIDWKKARLLIFGSEAGGLSAEEREKISENLIIPMGNAVESLNLAVACGVILFEARRQSNAGQPL